MTAAEAALAWAQLVEDCAKAGPMHPHAIDGARHVRAVYAALRESAAQRLAAEARVTNLEAELRIWNMSLQEQSELARKVQERDELLREAADMLVHRDTDAADAIVRDIRALLERGGA